MVGGAKFGAMRSFRKFGSMACAASTRESTRHSELFAPSIIPRRPACRIAKLKNDDAMHVVQTGPLTRRQAVELQDRSKTRTPFA